MRKTLVERQKAVEQAYEPEVLSKIISETPKERRTKGLLYDEFVNVKTRKTTIIHNWIPNRVVNQFYVLVGGLLKGQYQWNGIQYWAIGSGEASWDALNATERAAKSLLTLTTLYSEIVRVVPSLMYLDDSDTIVTGPTHRLQISAVFGTSVSGYLRELGLFGGTATSTVNTGYMLNHRAHPVIGLNILAPETILNRILRLTL